MAFPSIFLNEKIAALKKSYDSGGMEEVIRKSNEELGKWKTIPLNIALIGRSGVGKSSLINALMGLNQEDEGAAKVDVVETTEFVEPFPHPKNKNLVFYDLPGVGTEKFPRQTYLTREEIGFENYDVFIIVIANRSTEDDVWLGSEIAGKNKPYVYVRSQIGIDLIKKQSSHKNLFDRDFKAAVENTVSDIRIDCEKKLKSVEGAKLYLVDSYDTKHYDFAALNLNLMDSVPEWKKEAFVLAMSNTTDDLIDKKNMILTDRIYQIALLSAAGGALPIPGVSMAIDAGIILKELRFYHTQYGTAKAFNQIQVATEKSAEEIIKLLELSDFSSASMTAAVLISKVPSLITSEVLERSATLLIPILGSIVGGVVSYGSTVYALKQILAKVTDDAHKISKYMLQQSAV